MILQESNESHLPRKEEKYLKRNLPGSHKLEWDARGNVSAAIVVPALCEYENIKKLLESLVLNSPAQFDEILTIIIVNNTLSAATEIKEDNAKAIKLLKSIIAGEKNDDAFVNIVIDSGLRLGLIDASSKGLELPDKDGGVGLARKTGMDIALSVLDAKGVNNLLVCLDADCTVSQNYFEEIIKLTRDHSFHAGEFCFAHPLDEPETQKAIICYEIFLHYYVAALKTTGSYYAFHTIGSTMLCSAEAYIKCGGMNKRKAAEDFYFMEKLAKNYPVRQINSASVFPAPRTSFRVPFGTGQRVRRFMSEVQNEYVLYSIKSFEVLKAWLKVFDTPEILPAKDYLKKAKDIDPCLYDFLADNNFNEEWERIIKNSKQQEQVQKQKIFWFDGFKTLKLIHYLRDKKFPPESMFDCLDELFRKMNVSVKIKRDEQIPPVETQKEFLAILKTLSV